jgi:predicted nucleic acid-binding protein
VAEIPLYVRPYFDSDVFIGWIKNERIPQHNPDGTPVLDINKKPVMTERGKIAEHLLTLAEHRVFPVVISAVTIAEVHKKRGKVKLEGDENQNVLDYLEHDFVNVVIVDRAIGEEANRLCRKYEKEGLMPNDAIHLACAIKAGCDVLLSWDGVLNSIKDCGIRIERPVMWIPPEKPKPAIQPVFPELQEVETDAQKGTTESQAKAVEPISAEVRRSDSRCTEGEAGAESAKKET